VVTSADPPAAATRVEVFREVESSGATSMADGSPTGTAVRKSSSTHTSTTPTTGTTRTIPTTRMKRTATRIHPTTLLNIANWDGGMLRITNTTRPDGVTVMLEGRLAGPWVDEVAGCWKTLRTTTQDASSIYIQLDAVTFIDAAGKALLRKMHEERAVLAASGCMTRAILEEIKQK